METIHSEVCGCEQGSDSIGDWLQGTERTGGSHQQEGGSPATAQVLGPSAAASEASESCSAV